MRGLGIRLPGSQCVLMGSWFPGKQQLETFIGRALCAIPHDKVKYWAVTRAAEDICHSNTRQFIPHRKSGLTAY